MKAIWQKKKEKKKDNCKNYHVFIHFYVNWSAPSSGGTGFFPKVTKLHHICTLDLGIKFNITNRKLAVIAHFHKYKKVWPLIVIKELQISIVLSIWLGTSRSEHAHKHFSFLQIQHSITFFLLNSDKSILLSNKR